MEQTTINRYQRGGDIYATLAAQYGAAAADIIAAAAMTGDETNVNSALVQVKYGNPLNDSTASNFVNQINNDPLQAPANWAGNLLANSIKDLGNAVKKAITAGAGNFGIWILVGLGLVGLFFYFGGANAARKAVAKL